MLAQPQTVQRVCCCCWRIRWQKLLRLPAAHLLHNGCSLPNYSSLAAGPALHTQFGVGGTRELHIYTFICTGGNTAALKGFYYFQPKTLIMSANPTIVQVFDNRGSVSSLPENTPTPGSPRGSAALRSLSVCRHVCPTFHSLQSKVFSLCTFSVKEFGWFDQG